MPATPGDTNGIEPPWVEPASPGPLRWRVGPEQAEPRALLELVDLTGTDVLEVGAGDGRLTWRYAGRAKSVLGIDAKQELAVTARAQRPPDLRDRVSFIVADIVSAPLAPAAFDVVVLSWTL